MGAEVAIWLALTGALEVQGVVAIAPGGPFMDNPDVWSELAGAYTGDKLCVTLIYGTADTSIPQANIPVLAEILQNAGVRCELEVLPGVGHEYDPAYIAPFLRGLN